MGDGTEPTLTLRDASRATGLSVKALRRRVERGTLPAQLVGGVRRVPISELLRAGLLVTGPGQHPAAGTPPGDGGTLVGRIAALEERVRVLEERDR